MNRSERMEAALRKIDELTNLLDIPENNKRLLFSPSHSYVAVQIRKLIRDALALPRRNCDVGTANEQQGRYDTFERRRWMCGKGKSAMEWGQMPYESETKNV